MNLSHAHLPAHIAVASALATASVAGGPAGPARADPPGLSVVATIHNDTNSAFTLKKFTVTEGTVVRSPAATIEPAGSSTFRVTTPAGRKGVAGEVRYTTGGSSLLFTWGNDEGSESSFHCSVPSPLICMADSVNERRAEVTFRVSEYDWL